MEVKRNSSEQGGKRLQVRLARSRGYLIIGLDFFCQSSPRFDKFCNYVLAKGSPLRRICNYGPVVNADGGLLVLPLVSL